MAVAAQNDLVPECHYQTMADFSSSLALHRQQRLWAGDVKTRFLSFLPGFEMTSAAFVSLFVRNNLNIYFSSKKRVTAGEVDT